MNVAREHKLSTVRTILQIQTWPTNRLNRSSAPKAGKMSYPAIPVQARMAVARHEFRAIMAQLCPLHERLPVLLLNQFIRKQPPGNLL